MKTVYAVLALMVSAVVAQAAPASLDVWAQIDGRSQLILQDGTAQWHHYDFDRPGLWQGSYPTRFSSTLDGVPVMGDVEWWPTWDGNLSSVFDSIQPALGQSTVTLTTLQARENAGIVQLPDASNGFTTIIEFNDNNTGGADWYGVRLGYEVVPEPASMLGLGLGAAVILRRRKK